MTTFWKNLAEVAKGQLFIGGHLSTSVVADIATKHAQAGHGSKGTVTRCDHSPWPRLAMPH